MSRKSLILTVLVAGVTVLVALVAFGGRFAGAQDPTPVQPGEVIRTVSVNGEGEVTAAPDQATIQLGVRTQAETAAEALEENNQRMQALLNTLREAGVAAADMQTSDMSIWPQYRHSPNGTSSVTGYEVSNAVSVTVRDLENFGAILDAAVRAGGNQVNGISFGFSDPTALLNQAREAAMVNAQAKAARLAELAGVRLGTVVTISETGAMPPPIMVRAAQEAMADAAVPIEAGESAVNVMVQVTYELVP
jgi:uncharacterized protein